MREIAPNFSGRPLPVNSVQHEPREDVLYEGQYRRLSKKGECPTTKPAVVVDGPEAGKVLFICRDEKCRTHAPVTRYQPTPQERAARSKELLAERVEKQTRFRILGAIRRKLSTNLTHPELQMVALDYFSRLGHDNHRRLCRTYAWPEKKTKTSWGALCVDYTTAASKALAGMNSIETQHFLLVRALVSDLACPGYDPRQSLAKDSNLARTASPCKVDREKLAAEVRGELTKKSTKGGAAKKAKR